MKHRTTYDWDEDNVVWQAVPYVVFMALIIAWILVAVGA
jgi:hypothetical protein